jgi:hypothetical protein
VIRLDISSLFAVRLDKFYRQECHPVMQSSPFRDNAMDLSHKSTIRLRGFCMAGWHNTYPTKIPGKRVNETCNPIGDLSVNSRGVIGCGKNNERQQSF